MFRRKLPGREGFGQIVANLLFYIPSGDYGVRFIITIKQPYSPNEDMLYLYELFEKYKPSVCPSTPMTYNDIFPENPELYLLDTGVALKHAEGEEIRIRQDALKTFVLEQLNEWYQQRARHDYKFVSCMIAERVAGDEVRDAVLSLFYPIFSLGELASIRPVRMDGRPFPQNSRVATGESVVPSKS
jgi:hypothetical protein